MFPMVFLRLRQTFVTRCRSHRNWLEAESHAAEYLKGSGRAQESVIHPRTVRHAVGWNPRSADPGRVTQDAPGGVLAVKEIVD